jgi:tetraacyldisaccharide 4'-kinase
VARESFADHHRFTADEVMTLVELAAAREATLVTTAKDAVRLPPEARSMVQVLEVELAWQSPAALDALLARAIG